MIKAGTRDKGQGTGACKGFTFVELLLAATMLAVLTVGLAAHLRGGVLVWRRTSTGLETLQRRRVALDRLATDLANAVTFSDASPDAPLPPVIFGQAELRIVSVDRGYGVRPPSLRMVSYRCGDEDGVPGLWRRSETLAQARLNDTVAPQQLLPGCSTLRLRYGYAAADGTLEWKDDWLFPDELPQAIEAQLQLGEGRTLRRVLELPSGALKPSEAAAGA